MHLNYRTKSRDGGSISKLTNRTGFILLLFALFQVTAQSLFAQASPLKPGESETGKLAALSLAGVRRLLNDLKDDVISPGEAMAALVRGVDFRLTPEIAESLRQLGATEAILKVIATVEPKEEVMPKGALSLSCSPAECQIRIEGGPTGVTSDGRLLMQDLTLGDVIVDFEKAGYFSAHKTVRIAPGAPIGVSATLEMTPETQLVMGTRLFDLCLRAIGSGRDLKDLVSVSGGGAISLYKAGTPTDWDFEVSLGPPALVEMRILRDSSGLLYQCAGETCGQKRKTYVPLLSSKQVSRTEGEELGAYLKLFARYNFTAVLKALAGSSVRFSALTANETSLQEQHLDAQGDDFAYHVTLGPDLLPVLVEYESKERSGSGTKISYDAYSKLGNAQYPKHTTIRLPGTDSLGLQVRLESLKAGSPITESRKN